MTLTQKLADRLHPRLRYFLKQILFLAIGWLALAGLVSILKGNHPTPSFFLVFAVVFGAGFAALARDVAPAPKD